jgi:hypothetical protein
VQNGTRLTGKHRAATECQRLGRCRRHPCQEATTWEASGSLHNRHASRELTLQAHFAPWPACRSYPTAGWWITARCWPRTSVPAMKRHCPPAPCSSR